LTIRLPLIARTASPDLAACLSILIALIQAVPTTLPWLKQHYVFPNASRSHVLIQEKRVW